jgi:hypothetical protein
MLVTWWRTGRSGLGRSVGVGPGVGPGVSSSLIIMSAVRLREEEDATEPANRGRNVIT